VSAIEKRDSVWVEVVAGVVGRRLGFTSDVIAAFGPSRQILVAASLAAERPPPRVHGTYATQDAQASVAHPIHSTTGLRRFVEPGLAAPTFL
jgi:hypothetical protein